MAADPKTREALLRTLPEQERDAIPPISTQRFEAAVKKAEAERNAVRRPEQSPRVAPSLRFR